MVRAFILGAALVLAAAAPVWAQEEEDAIVVTASRYQERFESFTIPHVAITRRADSAAMDLTISSDTRDAATRRAELQEALRGVARLGNSAVTLGILREDAQDEGVGRTRIIGFSVEAALDLLRQGGRADTSQVTIVLRTPVRESDTLEGVEERLQSFSRNAPKPGRIEYFTGRIELVLINPSQYRAPVIGAITSDSSTIVRGLGAGYGVRLEGLENPVAWKRAGDLDLRLFVPYRMVVLPAGSE